MDASEVSFNVHDHGTALDEKKRKVKCSYCAKVVSGFSRLKCHLGGIRGDVLPCIEVPAELKELIKTKLIEQKRGSLSKEVGELSNPNLPWKRNWSPSIDDFFTAHELETKKQIKVDYKSETKVDWSPSPQSTVGSQAAENGGTEDSSVRHAQKAIAQFFYENGLDFTAVSSISFQRMINATTLASGQIRYKIPSFQELKGSILEDEVKDMQQYVKEIRESWVKTGCSIILDGWVDGKGRNLMNILVDCPRGPIYLRSYDISASISNVDALVSLFDEIMREVGLENVIQVITYSISECMEAVSKRLLDKHRSFFWAVCVSHCIGLILENIGAMPFIYEVMEKAKTITRFIHSNAAVLKLVRQFTNGSDLIKPAKVRSAMPFLALENIYFEKENLENLFLSPELKSSPEGEKVAEIVLNHPFWTGAMIVLKTTIPLIRVLDLISESEKSQLGYIYETIDQAKETIKEELKSKRSLYMPVWKAVDDIWNPHLYCPIHAAGYFLNPSFLYSSDFFADAEVASGFTCTIVRLVEDKRQQDLIMIQVELYRNGYGAFAQGKHPNIRASIPPAVWWTRYGGHCPELQKLAIRVLSQTCTGASKFELERGMAEKLLEKGRNGVEQKKLSDLAFVHYNMQLKNYMSGICTKVKEIDAMDEWVGGDCVP